MKPVEAAITFVFIMVWVLLFCMALAFATSPCFDEQSATCRKHLIAECVKAHRHTQEECTTLTAHGKAAQ